MEENEPLSLFETDLDTTGQTSLLNISKWTKFIAITAFIVLGLTLLGLVAAGERVTESLSTVMQLDDSGLAAFIIAIVALAIVYCIVWMYFLYRSSVLLKKGVLSKSTADIAEGFKALKIFFVLSAILSVLGIISTLWSITNL